MMTLNLLIKFSISFLFLSFISFILFSFSFHFLFIFFSFSFHFLFFSFCFLFVFFSFSFHFLLFCSVLFSFVLFLFIYFLPTGAFSDRSDERELYNDEIERKFSGKGHEEIESNAQDGTFFMR